MINIIGFDIGTLKSYFIDSCTTHLKLYIRVFFLFRQVARSFFIGIAKVRYKKILALLRNETLSPLGKRNYNMYMNVSLFVALKQKCVLPI